MPKDTRPSSSRQTQLTPFLDPLVVVYEKRKVAIRRTEDYQTTLSAIKRSVRALAHVPASDLILKSNTIPHQEGDYVDISEDAWPDLVFRSYIKSVTIEVENHSSIPAAVRPTPLQLQARPSQNATLSPSSTRENSQQSMVVKVMHFTAEAPPQTLPMRVKSTTTVSTIHMIAAERFGMCKDEFSLVWEGSRMQGHQTVAELGIEDGDVIDTLISQLGGKPVIYLSPPTSGPAIDATVELSLSSSWSLSALYPLRPESKRVHSSYGQKSSWTVRADPKGTLYDKATETEVSYLYWEATTNPPRPLSPPLSPRSAPTLEEFDPSRARLSADDSVLLPVDKVPAYLDRALATLALHTEARTSFITYWLPSILKHTHVALRFVPQAEYEQAARLTVTPTPDVTTRVFMVFRGVQEGELLEWVSAVERASEDVTFWRNVVGVDVSAAHDSSLFRVLEWGGMEIVNDPR